MRTLVAGACFAVTAFAGASFTRVRASSASRGWSSGTTTCTRSPRSRTTAHGPGRAATRRGRNPGASTSTSNASAGPASSACPSFRRVSTRGSAPFASVATVPVAIAPPSGSRASITRSRSSRATSTASSRSSRVVSPERTATPSTSTCAGASPPAARRPMRTSNVPAARPSKRKPPAVPIRALSSKSVDAPSPSTRRSEVLKERLDTPSGRRSEPISAPARGSTISSSCAPGAKPAGGALA